MIFANVVVLGLFIPEALSDVFRIGYISGSKKIKHASAYGRPGYQISGAISLAVNQINEHHPGTVTSNDVLTFCTVWTSSDFSFDRRCLANDSRKPSHNRRIENFFRNSLVL